MGTTGAMAGIGRIILIALVLALFPGGGGRSIAATIFAPPGSPEGLIFDAGLSISTATRRGLPAERSAGPAIPGLPDMKTLGKAAVLAQCVATGATTASALGTGTGIVWALEFCLDAPKRKPLKPGYSFGMASLGSYPRYTLPTTIRQPSAGRGRYPGITPAPIPLPATIFGFATALAALALFRRR